MQDQRTVTNLAADAIYQRIVGAHRIHIEPGARYRKLNRAQASGLIESCKRAAEVTA